MFEKVFSQNEQSVLIAELSMAPIIDMVFLLLIFFAVTTNFTKEAGIEVDKANAKTAKIINHKNILLIAVDKEGNYWYDEKNQRLENIVNQVYEEKLKKTDVNIVLVPDKGGKVDPLIHLMDALRARDITKFSLGTRMIKER